MSKEKSDLPPPSIRPRPDTRGRRPWWPGVLDPAADWPDQTGTDGRKRARAAARGCPHWPPASSRWWWRRWGEPRCCCRRTGATDHPRPACAWSTPAPAAPYHLRPWMELLHAPAPPRGARQWATPAESRLPAAGSGETLSFPATARGCDAPPTENTTLERGSRNLLAQKNAERHQSIWWPNRRPLLTKKPPERQPKWCDGWLHCRGKKTMIL